MKISLLLVKKDGNGIYWKKCAPKIPEINPSTFQITDIFKAIVMNRTFFLLNRL